MIAMVNAFRWMIFVIGLAVIISSIMVTSAGNPIIVINSPSDGDTIYTDEITVSGGATGAEDAIVKSVTVNGISVRGTTDWSKEISLQPGLNEITVVAEDNMGQSRSKTISVTYIDSTSSTTFTTISNGGYRPTPTPAPTPAPTGSITIITSPSGAEIHWDDVFKGNTTITLEDVRGDHRVKISKEGFKNKTSRISLYEDMPITRHFKLEPINGSIAVSSTPSGASVYLDNDNMSAITPCMLNVNVGEHTLKLTKSDYFDETENVSVSVDKMEDVHVNLTGYGSISISSNVDGAYVYLDNNYMNKTCELSEVVVGQHTIKLTKSGYFNVTKNVSVSVGITHPVRINLTECGSISISTKPSGAKVYLDGNYKGETPKDISKVPQGNHTIKLTKSDYDNVIRNVSVSVGETLTLHENLTGYGSLSISTKPSGAEVYLDGNYTEKTPLDIPKVVEGSHSIKLTKFCYVTANENIDVSVGEPTDVNVPLSINLWVRLLIEGGIIAVILAAMLAFIAPKIIAPKIIAPKIIPGPSNEKYLLFSLDPSCRQHLKDGDVDEKLKKVFEDNEQSLSSEAKLSKIAEWKIEDGRMQYSIEDTEKRLNVYKKED